MFILLVALISCAWVAGGYKMITELITFVARDAPTSVISLVSLVIWLVLTLLFVTYNLLWEVMGKEIIHIDGDKLTIRREPFGAGRMEQYTLDGIRHLRFYPWDEWATGASRNPYWRQFRSRTAGQSLAFEYGSRTYRFGIDLDEQEAKGLLKAITERFPDISL